MKQIQPVGGRVGGVESAVQSGAFDGELVDPTQSFGVLAGYVADTLR
ncbi:hypothetical protein IU510_21050 [Nocardia cyriacigeorgica]|nr:hypothetical protein [Nocardia cyriacigeorgica]MBF6100549.1 hypothetical protein [Nocardia cyriacigeorgica]